MKKQKLKYQVSKIGFYNSTLIEIRKVGDKYSLYVNHQLKSNKVSDFRIVGDYIFCSSRFYSLIYYSFKTDELFEVNNIGDYATWSLKGDEIVTYKYIEEKTEIEAYKFNLKTKKIDKLQKVSLMFEDINGHKFSTDNKFTIKCKSNNWEANIEELNLGKVIQIKCIIDNHVVAQTRKNLIGLNLENGLFEWSYEIVAERMLLNQSSKTLINPKTKLKFQKGKIKKLDSNLNIENKAVVNMGSFDIDEKFIYFPLLSKNSKNQSLIKLCKASQEDYSIVDKIELYSDELLNHTKQLKVHKNKIYVINQGNELTIIEHE